MDGTDENFDRNRGFDFLLFCIDYIHFHTLILLRRFDSVFRIFFENIQISELVDAVSDKLAEHPILKFVALTAAFICALPVMMFVVFGIFSVIVTFIGFLFIEGTLLAIGGLCMFISIVTITMIMSIMAATLGILYILSIKLGVLLSKFESTSNILRSIAPTLIDREGFQVSHSAAELHQD